MSESPTARKRETDAGYKPLPIGTRDRPWPTRQRGEDNGVRTFGMGVIQSDTDPLWLHSAREYKHVLPELMRNMPVPGMLDAFEAILHNPLVYLESDPAYGKSYLANLIGNAMHPQGAVIYDAGGKNMESLLFETVEVQPIEWLKDPSGMLVARQVLFAGVQFDRNQRYDGNFANTDMKKYLDRHFAKEMVAGRNVNAPAVVGPSTAAVTARRDTQRQRALDDPSQGL